MLFDYETLERWYLKDPKNHLVKIALDGHFPYVFCYSYKIQEGIRFEPGESIDIPDFHERKKFRLLRELEELERQG